jgi:hypothetical protein
MTRAEVVVRARKLLDVSQSRLAECMGVSSKAIQSYEQGWRMVPNRIFSQLFILLTEFKNSTQGIHTCWEQKGCTPNGCPSCQSGTGCCCWMLAADRCPMMNSDEKNPDADFVSCPVFARLLSD